MSKATHERYEATLLGVRQGAHGLCQVDISKLLLLLLLLFNAVAATGTAATAGAATAAASAVSFAATVEIVSGKHLSRERTYRNQHDNM
jgi:hypothetical protein